MESHTPSFRTRNFHFLQNTPQDTYQQPLCTQSSPLSPLSIPPSESKSPTNSKSKFNSSNPLKKNKLLDRIRTELTNIKSEVFKMTKTNKNDYSPSKSIDSNLDRSIDRQSLISRIQGRIPTEPSQQYDINYYKYQNNQLVKDNQLLKQKLDQKQDRYKNEKSELNNKVRELEYQLMEKQKKFNDYEYQLQQEIERFKSEFKEYNDKQGIRKKIFYLESIVEQANGELIYLKKRTSDDAAEIKKYTIENYELKKQIDGMRKEKSQLQLHSQLSNLENSFAEEVNRLKVELQQYRAKDVKDKQREKERERQKSGKQSDRDSKLSEQIKLQQNTIEVLEFELSKSLKENKRLQSKNEQELRNVKITYQKLLESVKNGLTECFKAQIDDLRTQLSYYNPDETQGIYSQSTRPKIQKSQLTLNLPPRNTKPENKIINDISSEIIIVEEDESLEETERKNTLEEEINSSQQELKRRIEYLQGVIQGLEKQIQQLKWVRESTTPQTQRNSLLNDVTLQNKQNIDHIKFLELKNKKLIDTLYTTETEKDSLLDQIITKQYTTELSNNIIGRVIEQQIVNKKCLDSINSEMQFVIQKLKIRNYQSERRVEELQKVIQHQNWRIDELNHEVEQMQIKCQEQNQINKLIINKVHSLEEQNIKLCSEKDIEKQKSHIKLKQLNQYKSALETEITKRENKISHLKDEISSIVGQQGKKKNSIMIPSVEGEKQKEKEKERQKEIRKIKDDELIKIQKNQIQSLQLIIKNLQQQLHHSKIQHVRKKTSQLSKDQQSQVKQLKSQLIKKNQQIYQYKNQNAVTRLRCDSLKSEQEVERLSWITQKKNLEIKLERQIQNLMRDLSLEKQTVEFLASHIKSLESQLCQKDDIISKMFSRKKDDIENCSSIEKRAKREEGKEGDREERMKTRSFMGRKLSQNYKIETKNRQNIEIPKITQIETLDLNIE